DGEYKQKSATQTPSGHLSTTSEAEISCKATNDERVLYQSNNDEELHYAELSLPSGGASSSAPKKSISVDCSSSMLLQGAGINPNLGGITGGTLPHGSSVRKLLPTIPATSTLQRNKTMAPPPSYDYFEEPTIYAQIDHYKNANASASNSSSVSPFPPCISSPNSQGTPSTVSPGTVQMYTLPPHPGGYHTLPHNHHQQNVPPHSSTTASMMQMMGNAQNSSAAAAGASSSTGGPYHHGTLPMPPSYQQHQQQQQQQQQQMHLQQLPSPPLGQVLVSSNSSGLATAAVTSPSSSISGLSAVGKSYSREIVTVRTPLMYSQQESCV
uniref:Uncharacterized protein n=1 Tax=Musca domestica TaxID=7370 RepID=A0A1I8N8L1_MUSDO